MAFPLSIFARPYILDRKARASLTCPVLVLESDAPSASLRVNDETLLPTSAGGSPKRPTLTEPLVYEVKKAGKAANAFLMGITIGRTDNNDIGIADESISRFHAWFARDPASDLWRITDVGSLNGTTVNGVKLEKDVPKPLGAREVLVVGKVTMLFLLPQAFFPYVDGRI